MKTQLTQSTRPVGNGDTNQTPTQRLGVVITPPNMYEIVFQIRGTAPLRILRFSEKAQEEIRRTQEAGSTTTKGKKREPKNFTLLYELAKHVAVEGWLGLHASAFRNAAISVCRICGFHMTKAKLSIFCVANGYDKNDGSPLVRITKGTPSNVILPVRNSNGGIDLRPAPQWEPGWEMFVTMRFDADVFTPDDITSLMQRIGLQVGVGEGRPDGREGNGIMYGLFNILRVTEATRLGNL